MALRAVPDHPKFAHLKSLLKLPKAVVLGYLECMWHFTGRYTPQGNIGKYSDLAIESWMEWDGEEGKLIDVFIKSGWLDIDDTHRLIVHDWHQHADKAARQSLKRAKLNFLLPDGTEVPPFAQKENSETENGNGVLPPGQDRVPPWGLPVPVPVPEPVINTPPPRAREAEPENLDDPPEGLARMQYAAWLVQECGIPSVPHTMRSAEAAIETFGRTRKLPDHIATVKLRDLALAAKNRGDPVNKFWLEDPNKWEPKANGGGNGTTNRHAKTGGNLDAVAEFARRRGIDLRRANEIGGGEAGRDYGNDAGGLHGNAEILPP